MDFKRKSGNLNDVLIGYSPGEGAPVADTRNIRTPCRWLLRVVQLIGPAMLNFAPEALEAPEAGDGYTASLLL